MQILIDFCEPRRTAANPITDGEPTHDHHASQTDQRLRCAFANPLQTLVAHTPEQVKPLLDAVQNLSQQGFWCVGYLRYEAASAFDAALVTQASDGPLAWFGVFQQALPWPDSSASAALAGNTRIDWQSSLTQSEFDANMARIHQAIAAGEFYQINYTAPWHGQLSGSPQVLFERLQRAQPGGYAALIDTGAEQLLSVSPELFFDWNGDQILTRPMKGTAPRGNTPQADAALAAELVQSPKERAENVMIVDLLRNDLSRIALPHSVTVPTLFQVQSLPTVHQMVSDVTAHTRPGTTLADVFAALFPCGSITGAPKVRAMQMIRAIEPHPRGVYCGSIGVVRPGGHATFNVAIRTVTLQGKQACCGIGSGITADATAADEWREWQHKRGFLTRASQRFDLLETLRLQHGEYDNLVAHIARMKRAAAHFAYPFDETRVRQALASVAANCSAAQADDNSVWRVRLLLDANGLPDAQVYEQKSTPAPVGIALAALPFEAFDSEFSRFKTTHRAHYEAFAPTNPAVFDTLLYNPRGELTECTRGNIAVLIGGQWLTPALHCGLLDGVGRGHWISQGRLREAVITLADLPQVQALAFVNSLRGWVEARLAAT
ncbi:MAG: aminodeoxychorismate synthase component I [Comamonadaceae bacterium]|nr:aminodeoxychorismate synthase component I [Comamonadaceae bacterium]